MLLSKLGLFLLSVGIVILGGIALSAINKRHWNGKYEGIGWGPVIFLTFAIWFSLMALTPEVIILTESDNDIENETSYVLFSYEGHSVRLGKVYIANRTSEKLIIYPQTYTSSKEYNVPHGNHENDITIIEPQSLKLIKHAPDHYFYVPTTVRSKHSGKSQIDWIIEKYSKIEEEYLKEQELKERFMEEHGPILDPVQRTRSEMQ